MTGLTPPPALRDVLATDSWAILDGAGQQILSAAANSSGVLIVAFAAYPATLGLSSNGDVLLPGAVSTAMRFPFYRVAAGRSLDVSAAVAAGEVAMCVWRVL